MKAWSDEWRCARLELRLRDDELFHGEAVALEVRADVPPSLSSRDGTGGARTVDAVDRKLFSSTGTLVQRWRDHCEGARVQIRVVEAPTTDAGSGATLFRQETQFECISGENQAEGASAAVLLRAHFDLQVRREFWNRAVVLRVRITPTSSAVDDYRAGSGGGGMKPEAPWIVTQDPLAGGFLTAEWTDSQLFPLIREEAQPTAVMTRDVEKQIRITKPLELTMETRSLAGQRVGVLTRVVNAHPTLTLDVRDVHVHLDDLSLMPSAPTDATSRSSYFRLVKDDKVSFPVVLCPREHYNFVSVLELADETSLGQDRHTDRCMAGGRTQEKGNPNSPEECSASPAEHVLLTLSWRASGVPMDAITEIHTIKWSPAAGSSSLQARSNKDRIDSHVQGLVRSLLSAASTQVGRSHSSFVCVRLGPDSALQTTVTVNGPRIAVGEPVVAYITVTNRSNSELFDLTLVLPTQEESNLCVAGDDEARVTPMWVSLEASHHLGLLRPGMSVHRSVHLVFVRSGKCPLGPFLLVDPVSGGMTCTCYIACGREVFVGL